MPFAIHSAADFVAQSEREMKALAPAQLIELIGNWDTVTTCEMDWTGLKLLLEGIEPKRVRKRYQKNTVFIGKNTQ